MRCARLTWLRSAMSELSGARRVHMFGTRRCERRGCSSTIRRERGRERERIGSERVSLSLRDEREDAGRERDERKGGKSASAGEIINFCVCVSRCCRRERDEEKIEIREARCREVHFGRRTYCVLVAWGPLVRLCSPPSSLEFNFSFSFLFFFFSISY